MAILKKVFFIFIIMILWGILSCNHQEIRPDQTFQPPPKPAKIAVVLGAGSSRGFAHIGVLKVLESNKIPIHMIVGTSAGSAFGCLYAYGYDSFSLQKMSFSIEENDFVDISYLPTDGFIKGEKLEEFINKKVNNTPMEKFKIPFYAVVTDIENGQEVVFGKGNAGTAVRASCSIPGIFSPVTISNKMYVDGGVVSPVAVDVAKKFGADVVIAVDISSAFEHRQPEGKLNTFLQSINIMYSKLSEIQLCKADVVIRPKVGYIGSADVSKRQEAILEGEKAALEALPKIKEIVENLKAQGRLEQ